MGSGDHPTRPVLASIEEALDLLQSHSGVPVEWITQDAQLPSLLEQCNLLCEEIGARASRDSLRVLHALPGSKGTLGPELVSAAANTVLVTETDLAHVPPATSFSGHAAAADARAMSRGLSDGIRQAVFLSSLEALRERLTEEGQRLVLQLGAPPAASGHAEQSELIAGQYSVSQLLIAEPPREIFSAMSPEERARRGIGTLEDYCRSCLDYLDRLGDVPVVTTDAIAQSPQDALKRICAILDLPLADTTESEADFRLQSGTPTPNGGDAGPIYKALVKRLEGGAPNDKSARALPEQDWKRFSQTALDAWTKADLRAAFLLVETKSIPRSGLHFMKRSLTEIIGDDFSFCEWYTEPGCCGSMPCAMLAFAKKGKESGLRLRMTKSHDFALTDPVYRESGKLRRMVLVRDPVFSLTSWWVLDQITVHEKLLRANGINPEKIYYQHEKAVLEQAYELIGSVISMPTDHEIKSWLNRRGTYIQRFSKKWVLPVVEDGLGTLCRYDELPDRLVEMLRDQKALLSEAQLRRLEAYASGRRQSFSARSSPFAGPTPEISAILERHGDKFLSVGKELSEQYPF